MQTKRNYKALLIISLLWASLISLGLKESINSMFNILFLTAAISWGDWGFLRGIWKKSGVYLATLILVLIYVLGVFYSQDMADAWRRVMIKIMLALWPLGLILVWPRISSHNWYRATALVPALFGIACLIRGLWRYFGTGEFSGDTAVFMYYRLSAWIMHPNYIMLFLGAGTVVLWWHWLKEKSVFSKIIDFSLFTFILVFSVFFLQARTGVIFLLIPIVILTVIDRFRAIGQMAFWRPILICLLIFLSIGTLLPDSFFQRWQVNTSTEFVDTDDEDTSLSGRLVIWENCLACIREAPIFGHGTGDGVHRLHQMYTERGFKKGEEDLYNCHNQYLETYVAVGLPGILMLIWILWLSVKQIHRNPKTWPLAAFVLFFFGAMMFESILERHKGVMIFAIFTTTFYLMTLEENWDRQIEEHNT
ncbi:MAG: O-antigen ligase family protein [Cryomorphaceae bacterium]|nr:O-antigen ligase family protein [Cryomorphaceae bacterium]